MHDLLEELQHYQNSLYAFKMYPIPTFVTFNFKVLNDKMYHLKNCNLLQNLNKFRLLIHTISEVLKNSRIKVIQ